MRAALAERLGDALEPDVALLAQPVERLGLEGEAVAGCGSGKRSLAITRRHPDPFAAPDPPGSREHRNLRHQPREEKG